MSQPIERNKATGPICFLNPSDGELYLICPRRGPYQPGLKLKITRAEALNLGALLDRSIVKQELASKQGVAK